MMATVENNFKSPLRCWDIYSEYFSCLIKKSKIDHDLNQLESILKFELEQNVINKIMEDGYEALVLTDINQEILWVSNGFFEMTGYTKSFAVGKKPNFLQGPRTTRVSKLSIREQMQKREPFTDTLLNYRKNGGEYLCQVQIIPLFDKKNRNTHYLAIEKEVQAA